MATKKDNILASSEEAVDLIEECESIRKDVRSAQGDLMRKHFATPKLLKQYKSWWGNIFKEINAMYSAELALLDGLYLWAKEQTEKKKLASDACQRAYKIITKVDSPAQQAKCIMPDDYGLEPDSTRTKAELRKLIWLHYCVKCDLIKEKIVPKQLLSECIKKLEGSLEGLSWLRCIFISYSHKDSDELKKLVAAIKKPLEENYISIWYDHDEENGIVGSDDWNYTISTHIYDNDMSIVLISKNFFKSDYIQNKELKDLLVRRQKEGVRIYPIILDECNSFIRRHSWLKRTHFVPGGDKTIKKGYHTPAKRKALYGRITKELISLMDQLSDPNKAEKLKAKFEAA